MGPRDLYVKWSVSKGARAGHSLFTQHGRGSDATGAMDRGDKGRERATGPRSP